MPRDLRRSLEGRGERPTLRSPSSRNVASRNYRSYVAFTGRGEMIPNGRLVLRDRPQGGVDKSEAYRSCGSTSDGPGRHEMRQVAHMQEDTYADWISAMGCTSTNAPAMQDGSKAIEPGGSSVIARGWRHDYGCRRPELRHQFVVPGLGRDELLCRRRRRCSLPNWLDKNPTRQSWPSPGAGPRTGSSDEKMPPGQYLSQRRGPDHQIAPASGAPNSVMACGWWRFTRRAGDALRLSITDRACSARSTRTQQVDSSDSTDAFRAGPSIVTCPLAF